MADRPPDATITKASSNPSSDAKAEAPNSLRDKTRDTESSGESTVASAATAASVACSPDSTAAADEPFVGVQATTKVSECLGWKVYHDAPKPWSKEEKDKYFADMETHPLFMDEEDVEVAEKEGNQTLDAIKVLRDSQTPHERAKASKDDGNNFYRQALTEKKKKRQETLILAVNAYEEALEQAKKAATAMKGKDLRELSFLQSTIICNRAAVRLTQKLYSKAIKDCESAIKVWPGNLKAYWRWAKVLGALQRWSKGVRRCEIGLEVGRRLEVTEERHKHCFAIAKLRNKLQKKATAASVAKDEAAARKLVIAKKEDEFAKVLKARGLTIHDRLVDHTLERYASERASFDPATGQISWPLVLLYPEAHHSDFIQNVCEDNTLSDYIEMVFGERAQWDKAGVYTPTNVVVAFRERCVTGKHHIEEQRWVIVAPDCTLRDVLQHPAYEIARFPVLWVVPRTGEYLRTFLKAHKGRVTKMEINKEQT